MYSDVTCIRGSGKKKNRDFGYAARKSRMDNYYHKERAKTEREGIEMEARWGRREKEKENETRQGCKGRAMKRRRKVLDASTLI